MPTHPATARLLAVAVQKLRDGRPDEAVAPLRQAAALQPGHATIQHDLGLACLESGRLREAEAALRAAVTADPRFTDAHFRLGAALERLGDVAGAVAAYDRATELRPGFTEAWFRAGALVFTLGHRMEAIGCFRRAAATGPKTSFGRLGAARALLAEDRDAEAERVLRRLLALDRDHAMALDLLGNLLADAGRFEAARDCFARAIARAPLLAGAYYDLVRCRKVTAADADLPARMAAASAIPGLAPAQRLRVHLARGKAADDLGDHGEAMRQFGAAHAVRRDISGFDAAAFAARVDGLIARCPPGGANAAGNPDGTPVLIVGLPRSGTTLVEQILSSHPQVAAGGELNFWNDRAAAWLDNAAAGDEAGFLARAAADYLGVLRKMEPAAGRVTDKMPFNFLWAGLVQRALPAATIIHCRRHVVDTALSIHQTHFNPLLAFPTGGAELVAYVRDYLRLMAHWRRVLPPARFVEVDYESLTAAPEPAIRRIVAACGLGWDAACLHPERNVRVVKTASRWQARQPIYRDAVARWRRTEPWLGELRPLVRMAEEEAAAQVVQT